MKAFKAYDIRGVWNKDFNADDVYRIGFFLPIVLKADLVLVGRDCRLSSDEVFEALCKGITDSGASVADAGSTTTPTIYWATAKFGYPASVMITASHNPKDHNGLKVSSSDALPVGYDNGLNEIENLVESGLIQVVSTRGIVSKVDVKTAYNLFLKDYKCDFTGLKIGMDCSNGMASLYCHPLFGEDIFYINDEADADLARPLAYVAVEPPVAGENLPTTRSSMPNGAYRSAVDVAKEYIRAGDIFQVVLSQRFDIDLTADPFDVYRVLRQVNPSPYMYFLRQPDLTIVGGSPEPLVQLVNGRVVSRPIAGTRKRGVDDEHDKRLAGELRENPKEVAEHIMLVDLARNDVGRVSSFGSVQMDELMTLERYSHVMHLTSQVSGDLKPGLGPIDVLRATLPAGTVSGAPKVRAMEIIDELEPVKRGPYAGVVGYVDFSGNLDTAIAIRTMFVGPKFASLQAGAGIVADSDPADEDLECENKARALLATIPAAERMTQRRREAGTIA